MPRRSPVLRAHSRIKKRKESEPFFLLSLSLLRPEKAHTKRPQIFFIIFCSPHLSLSFVCLYFSPLSLSLPRILFKPPLERMKKRRRSKRSERGKEELSPFPLPPLLFPSTPLSRFPERLKKTGEKKKRKEERNARKLKNRTTEKNFDHLRRFVLLENAERGGKETETHLDFCKRGGRTKGRRQREDGKKKKRLTFRRLFSRPRR